MLMNGLIHMSRDIRVLGEKSILPQMILRCLVMQKNCKWRELLLIWFPCFLENNKFYAVLAHFNEHSGRAIALPPALAFV